MKNVVMLIGRLGKDPEVRYSQNGTAISTFSLATNESYKNRQGEKVEQTDWHRIVVFGKQAERVGEFLRQGRLVSVEGKIKYRTYTDKEGVTRKVTEIRASSVTFLPDGRQTAKGEATKKESAPAAPEAEGDDPVDETEIPF